MGEYDEFAEALMGQLSVEIDEENEIRQRALTASEDLPADIRFEGVGDVAAGIMDRYGQEIAEHSGMRVPDGLGLELLDIGQFKALKGRKVFGGPEARTYIADLFDAVAAGDLGAIAGLMERDTARYFVYSTYAIQYISKLSTTYGDYMDGTVYLNDFILSRYPRIILHKRGRPYGDGFAEVDSGYRGAVKMTVLEEMIHSAQGPLYEINRQAACEVNGINEELAGMILSLDPEPVGRLAEYCQLQAVPDEFPLAKRANLFFFLNPDHFLTGQIGPDVMTFTHVEIDPKIDQIMPELLGIYKRWLGPIQRHHAAFTVMEGMAEFLTGRMLKDDADFRGYLSTFMETDLSSYQVRKGMGVDFVRAVHSSMGIDAFEAMMQTPPDTRDVKEPSRYLEKLGAR